MSHRGEAQLLQAAVAPQNVPVPLQRPLLFWVQITGRQIHGKATLRHRISRSAWHCQPFNLEACWTSKHSNPSTLAFLLHQVQDLTPDNLIQPAQYHANESIMQKLNLIPKILLQGFHLPFSSACQPRQGHLHGTSCSLTDCRHLMGRKAPDGKGNNRSSGAFSLCPELSIALLLHQASSRFKV